MNLNKLKREWEYYEKSNWGGYGYSKPTNEEWRMFEKAKQKYEKALANKTRQNQLKSKQNALNSGQIVRTKGSLNYLRYGGTKNISQLSSNEKIKRLLNMYKTHMYSNEKKPLSNINKKIFGMSYLTANQIRNYLKNIYKNSISSTFLPSSLSNKLIEKKLPMRKPNRPKAPNRKRNAINESYFSLMKSFPPNYNKTKQNVLRKSNTNWISFSKRKNPLFLAYAIKYRGNLNNTNLAFFDTKGSINKNKKAKVLMLRNGLNPFNTRRHTKDPYKIASAMSQVGWVPNNKIISLL